MRKIGHFSKNPLPARFNDFESILDNYLPTHPDCIPYLMGSYGQTYHDEYNWHSGVKRMQNPVNTLEYQDLAQEKPSFSVSCPGTVAALAKLPDLKRRLDARNGLPDILQKFSKEIGSNPSVQPSGQQVPKYFFTVSVADLRDVEPDPGGDDDLRALVDECIAALERCTL